MSRFPSRESIAAAIPYVLALASLFTLFMGVILSIRPLYIVEGANAHGIITYADSEIRLLGERWSTMLLDVGLYYNRIVLLTIGLATALILAGTIWDKPGLTVGGGYLETIGIILAVASARYFYAGINQIDMRLTGQIGVGYLNLGSVRVVPVGPAGIVEYLAGGLIPLAFALLLFLLTLYYHYEMLGAGEVEAGYSGRT